MKKIFMLILVLFLVGCGAKVDTPDAELLPEDTTKTPVTPEEPVLIELTLAELAMYNGVDSEFMYIAVDGVIYDITNVKEWTTGEHNNNVAGTDLTEAIPNSPHKLEVLEDLKVVGTLID